MHRFKPKPRGRRVPEFDFVSPTGERAGRDATRRDATGRATAGRTELPPLKPPRPLKVAPAERPSLPAPVCWRVTRVAAYLDVSKKRVYQMIEEGKLEAVSVGPRGTRVLRASIERFLEGKEEAA